LLSFFFTFKNKMFPQDAYGLIHLPNRDLRKLLGIQTKRTKGLKWTWLLVLVLEVQGPPMAPRLLMTSLLSSSVALLKGSSSFFPVKVFFLLFLGSFS